MTVAAANMAREQYKKEQKRYTDHQRHLCMKEIEGLVDANIIYHGNQSTKLRMTKDVTAMCTKLGVQQQAYHVAPFC